MTRYKIIQLQSVIAAVSLAITCIASADECLLDSKTNQAYRVGKPSSWAITTQRANTTWDDWIWRGPIFKCTATGNLLCTYTWTQSQTHGYSWSTGLTLGVGDIPILGGVMGAVDASGSYTRSVSYTEAFGWAQQIKGGQYAQPVQVVRRRWMAGIFQGMDQNTGKTCGIDETGNGRYSPGHVYFWNGSATFGNWSGNNAQSQYGMYYVHY